MNDNRLPWDLRIVAWLFLLDGINAASRIIASTWHSHGMHRDLGLISFFVFFGLTRFWPGWRQIALVFIAIYIFLLPLVAATAYFTGIAGSCDFLGLHFFSIPSTMEPLVSCACFAVAVWEWRVLTRADVVALFRQRVFQPESLAASY